jgi:hypothetical protein
MFNSQLHAETGDDIDCSDKKLEWSYERESIGTCTCTLDGTDAGSGVSSALNSSRKSPAARKCDLYVSSRIGDNSLSKLPSDVKPTPTLRPDDDDARALVLDPRSLLVGVVY